MRVTQRELTSDDSCRRCTKPLELSLHDSEGEVSPCNPGDALACLPATQPLSHRRSSRSSGLSPGPRRMWGVRDEQVGRGLAVAVTDSSVVGLWFLG